MGFGHRIYRVRDPRADALKAAVRRARHGGRSRRRLALAEAVEAAALDMLQERKPGRPLETNVEFYTALLLEALGFPRGQLHLRLRHGPRRRLDRPCARAGAERPADPPAVALCRPGAAASCGEFSSLGIVTFLPGKAAAFESLREGQKVNCPSALLLSCLRSTFRRRRAKLLEPFLASQWSSSGFSSPDGIHLCTRGHDFQHVGETRIAV